MPYVSDARVISDCYSNCTECDWIWEPRPGTDISGSQGSKNAIVAARGHGEKTGHKVRVIRNSVYVWPIKKLSDKKKAEYNAKRQIAKKLRLNKGYKT